MDIFSSKSFTFKQEIGGSAYHFVINGAENEKDAASILRSQLQQFISGLPLA